jgi:hypothetical protein
VPSLKNTLRMKILEKQMKCLEKENLENSEMEIRK